MQRLDVPANVELMQLTPQRLQKLKPVRVLDIFEGGTQNYHEEGLFSVSIFGPIGSDERDQKFSYIDIKTTVLHPLVFKHLVKLKGLYGGIMAGKAYAVWNEQIKDFEASDQINGETGYYLFMKHWKNIKHKQTGSDIRDMRLKLIAKYMDRAETNKVLVLPAGLRDIQIDESGRTKEGEINPIYRSIIAISNAIGTTTDTNNPLLNTSRYSLQVKFNEAYENLEDLLVGKGGFMLRRWGSRNVYNGTRNVITSMDTSSPKLGASNAPGPNNTGIGLYQLAKSALPITKHRILNGWLKNVFGSVDGSVYLINPASLKKEVVKLASDTMDRWFTTSGIEKVINGFSEPALRLRPIIIDDYYLGLVYRPTDRPVFKIFGDIEELPKSDEFNRADVHPLSVCELIYLSAYRDWNNLGLYVTRYPVTGLNSIYPSHPYVKTTVISEMRWELGEDWQRIGDDHVALEYPTFKDPVFIDSLIPHPCKVRPMGGDFDGDTSSCNVVYTDEATAEVKTKLNTRSAYVNVDGSFKTTAVVETVERVLASMTGD